MNKTFLEYVAQDIINKFGSDLSRIAIVFPNKRAALFLNESLVRIADKPIWSPTYITISELFRNHSELIVGDPIKLICELHKSFTLCTGIDETLDHFYGWGQLLLADFDDIDKNMADAEKVFSNMKDIHELDDISYLNEEQKEALKKFFSNFKDDQNTELKQRFLSLWSHLKDIYTDFNARLKEEGIAYEGALYRQVIMNQEIDFQYDTYLFIGFNVLQKVEQQLFSRLKGMHKAHFYWDFDKYYINNNEAGHYIKQYLTLFPNELDNEEAEIYDNLNSPKEISFISASTENVQAHYVSTWLKEKERSKSGRNTAIVMCDESLLPTIIFSLPKEADGANITTGYPLSQTPFTSLISLLIELQTNGHQRDTGKYRLHAVNAVLHHPYAHFITERCSDLLQSLQECKRYYPSRSELSVDEGAKLLFADIESGDDSMNLAISKWLIEVLKLIGNNAKNEEEPLFQESLFRMYTLINRLSGLIESGDLEVDLITFKRLITQLIRSTTIPFHGEPAEGIQVMGVLETRNLDFEHVLLLSCNEGNMPKGVNDASFIPYSIRKAYELTTIDNKVAIYAYYFLRLLQRASDVTILYNDSTEDGHTGEMSRFMKQFLVESNQKISIEALLPAQSIKVNQPQAISKQDPKIREILEKIDRLSPTAINSFIRCQLSFYYGYIELIKQPDDNDDDQIDNRLFGNIFHRSAELIYTRLKSQCSCVQKGDLDNVLKHPEQIEMMVDQAFKEVLFKVENNSYQPEYNGLQLINREVIISYLIRLLEIDKQLTPFSIVGLECKVGSEVAFETSSGERKINVGGTIDRMDIIHKDGNDYIRVVDYKTGRAPSMLTYNMDEVFSGVDLAKKHSNYHLQAILYSLIVSNDKQLNQAHLPVSPALLYIQRTQGDDYDPTLSLGKDKITDVATYRDDFMQHLQQTLAEIMDTTKDFSPTDDRQRCDTCPYIQLCHFQNSKK